MTSSLLIQPKQLWFIVSLTEAVVNEHNTCEGQRSRTSLAVYASLLAKPG